MLSLTLGRFKGKIYQQMSLSQNLKSGEQGLHILAPRVVRHKCELPLLRLCICTIQAGCGLVISGIFCNFMALRKSASLFFSILVYFVNL